MHIPSIKTYRMLILQAPLIIFFAALILLLRPHSAMAACDPGPGQASFYVDAQFKGNCVVRGPGDYPDSGAIGLPNDSISSIRIGPKTQISICKDNNFGGDCILVTGDMPLLSGTRVGNDKISSVKVQTSGTQACVPGDTQVAFFEDNDYQGKCVVKNMGKYPNPSDLGIGNDTMSSILVGKIAEAIICVDANYGLDCIRIDRNTPALPIGARTFNDQVSSARVEQRGTLDCAIGPNQAAFFQHADYIAPCVKVGLGEYPDAGGLGSKGISSVLVFNNTHVCHYSSNTFTPVGGDITANTPNLGAQNDKVVAVRVQPSSMPCVTGTSVSVTPPIKTVLHPVVMLFIEADPKNPLSTGALHVHGTGFSPNDLVTFVTTSTVGGKGQAPDTSPPQLASILGVADYPINGTNGVCSDTELTTFQSYGYGTKDKTKSPVSAPITCGGNKPKSP